MNPRAQPGRFRPRHALVQIRQAGTVEIEAKRFAMGPERRCIPMQCAQMAERHVDIDMGVVGDVEAAVQPLPEAHAVSDRGNTAQRRPGRGPCHRSPHQLLRQFNTQHLQQAKRRDARGAHHRFGLHVAPLGFNAHDLAGGDVDALGTTVFDDARAQFTGTHREGARHQGGLRLSVAGGEQTTHLRNGVPRQFFNHFTGRKHHGIHREAACDAQPRFISVTLGFIARDEKTAVVAPSKVGLKFVLQRTPDLDAGLHQRHFGFVA